MPSLIRYAVKSKNTQNSLGNINSNGNGSNNNSNNNNSNGANSKINYWY